jgi:photosystem II stability/assembly factor-like uncharacterized protein
MLKNKTRLNPALIIIIIIAVVFVISSTIMAQQKQWEVVTVQGWNKGFQQVTYLGNNRVVAGTTMRQLNGGDIYLSEDGGSTWTQKVTQVANIRNFEFCAAERDIWLKSGDDSASRRVTGYVVGGAEGAGVAMYIGKTTDAGETWTDLSDNFRRSLKSKVSIPLYGLSVIDANKLYVSSREQVYKSDNGGQSWLQAGDIRRINPAPTQPLNRDLHFVFKAGTRGSYATQIPTTGFISSPGSLFITRDAGGTWTRLDPPWNRQRVKLEKLRFVDDQTGFALLTGDVETNFKGAVLLRTRDAGKTWSNVGRWSQAGGAIIPRTFYTPDGVSMWAGGFHEHIWHSNDGGNSWNLEHQSKLYRRVWDFQPGAFNAPLIAWMSSGSQGTSIFSYVRKFE